LMKNDPSDAVPIGLREAMKSSQHDYQVNLKAELEIRQLHEKIDHLLSRQWERLVEIQHIQIDLMSEISRIREKSPNLP